MRLRTFANLTPVPPKRQEQCLRGMIKTMDLGTDIARLNDVRNTLNEMWPIFDFNGLGHIDESQFKQQDGLADTIIAQMQQLMSAF